MKGNKTRRLNLLVTPLAGTAVEMLAATDGASVSATVEKLIRDEFDRRLSVSQLFREAWEAKKKEQRQ